LSGRDAVLSPQPTLYFDNRQSNLPQEPPGRLQVVSLEDVYGFDPVDPSLSPAQQAHILGVQANLWTEHIQTEDRLQWMALPRAAAVAELGWSPASRRSWPDFLGRLAPMMARYRSAGIRYADSVFAVDATITRDADAAIVSLSSQARRGSSPVGEIRYTTDGNQPSSASPAYAEPLRVPLDTLIRAASFVGPGRVSEVWQRRLDAQSFTRKDSHALELCTTAIGLLLEPDAPAAGNQEPIAVDIMNPCWIDRGVDLTHGATLTAAVVPLPFNYEIGADARKVRLGDAQTSDGELEIHVDGCDTPAAAILPLAPAARSREVTTLSSQVLRAQAGRHDLCFRFARPRLDPQWALDWIDVRE
jgi:hexosaminidase